MCALHLTHPRAHTPGAVDTHTHTHAAASGEQLGVRCLAQGSHFSRGKFLPEPRFVNEILCFIIIILHIYFRDHNIARGCCCVPLQ